MGAGRVVVDFGVPPVQGTSRVAPKFANHGASLFQQRNLGIHEKPLRKSHDFAAIQLSRQDSYPENQGRNSVISNFDILQ
jgi:hypothetical protein